MIATMEKDAESIPEMNINHEEADGSSLDQKTIKIGRENTPFNEFIENDRLLYSSFPFLILFGRGILSKGSLSEEATRHMLLQFGGQFSLCHRLIFLLFHQLQCHAATRVVNSRVKCNPESFNDFVNWINEPDFVEKLKAAAKDPLAPSSIALLKKMEPFIQSCASRIPFSSTQRGASIKNLLALQNYHGPPSFFFTFSPDDIHGLLNIRLSIGQKSNEDFPANGDGLGAAIQKGDSVFQCVPIASQDLRALVCKGPVAAAEIF